MTQKQENEMADRAPVTPEIRQQALDAALRCSHPGSIPEEVLRLARAFEAYLTGADTTATLP